MTDKKKLQLGMNPSTASHRLVKDVLWSLIVKTGQSLCCKCGGEMSRETFSIEHIEPWLDSNDPVGLYFSLENIGFSHHSCNVKAARRKPAVCGTSARYNVHGCRCQLCVAARSSDRARTYTKEKRQEKYRNKGY